MPSGTWPGLGCWAHLEQCPAGRQGECLPHQLPVQSCMQYMAASAAMQTERAVEGLSAGAGVPLLQQAGMLPAQVLLSPAWIPILGL